MLLVSYSVNLLDLSDFKYSNDLLLPQITQKEVFLVGKYLSISKAHRSDRIVNKILKAIMPNINGHLEQIFNDFLSINYYPTYFKESIVVILCK